MSTAGLGATGVSAADKLVVMSHAVHQKVATGETGGDVTAPWAKEHGAEAEWLTFGVDALHERAFREITLGEGVADVVFMLARYGGPHVAGYFEDLSAYQAKDPIDDFDDISAGMRAAHTHDGKLIGIPYRHATHGLHYNTTLLAERGLDGPPESFDELVEYAEKLTYTREDGTQVHGLVAGGLRPTNIIDFIRMNGGEFIGSDWSVSIDQPAAVEAVTILARLFKEGALPKGLPSFETEDAATYMQQGRAAMVLYPFSRNQRLNDPEKSKFPGEIAVTAIPSGSGEPAPAKTSVWAMGIPSNAPNKDLAWSFIKQLSQPESTVAEALNGNGPTRMSAYTDERVMQAVSYAADEMRVLADARLPMPGMENSAQVRDLFIEFMQSAVLGLSEPQAAMTELRERVEPLLPNAN